MGAILVKEVRAVKKSMRNPAKQEVGLLASLPSRGQRLHLRLCDAEVAGLLGYKLAEPWLAAFVLAARAAAAADASAAATTACRRPRAGPAGVVAVAGKYRREACVTAGLRPQVAAHIREVQCVARQLPLDVDVLQQHSGNGCS